MRLPISIVFLFSALFFTCPLSPILAATNLVPNASLESTDGTAPTSWAQGTWGTLSPAFTYPVPGPQGGKATQVSVSNYVDGDAKWYFNEVPVNAGATYSFSDWSLSSVNTTVVAQYRTNNNTYSYAALGTVTGSGAWKQFTKNFIIPQGVVALTVFHLIAQNGTLTVDDYSLTTTSSGGGNAFSQGMVTFSFDDGFRNTYEVGLPILDAAGIKSTQAIITKSFSDPTYITAEEVRNARQRGHEIASHTRHHLDLTTITPQKLTNQVRGSRNDLIALGITPIDTFVYPYGSYNADVIAAVEKAGYKGARGVQSGFNTPMTNKWALSDQHVTSDVTYAQIKGWIDEAVAKKQWLILELHQQNSNGGTYSNDPALLQQVVNYITSKSIKTVTLGEGIQMLSQ